MLSLLLHLVVVVLVRGQNTQLNIGTEYDSQGETITIILSGTVTCDHGIFPDFSLNPKLVNLLFVAPFGLDSNLPGNCEFPGILGRITTLKNVTFIGTPGSPLKFQGTTFGTDLPDSIGTNWSSIENFQMSHVSGMDHLPSTIVQWNKLKTFMLMDVNFDAQFDPVVPADLTQWSSLVTFEVNGLSTVSGNPQPLPKLGALSALQTYIIEFTNFQGQFNDPQLFTSPNLQTFLLAANNFLTGSLPDTLGSAHSLQTLTVTASGLTGTIPNSIGGLTSLTLLSTDIPFSGTLPAAIGQATSLRVIQMINTIFSGVLPSQLGRLGYLTQLSLAGQTGAGTGFQSLIPAELIALFNTTLVVLDLSNNQLFGAIPDIVNYGAPQSVHTINLSNNVGLECALPAWLVLAIHLMKYSSVCDFTGVSFCQLTHGLSDAEMQRCSIAPLDPATLCVCFACVQVEYPTSCPRCDVDSASPIGVDECGVCNGDGLECADCAGVPNGSLQVDHCFVCGGNNSCFDCKLGRYGPRIVDACGVCGGDGTSCADCSGKPFGSLVYDECDVCGGDNRACTDCAGMYHGPHVYDVCGHCVNRLDPHYRPTCVDCAGVPFGAARRDACGTCHAPAQPLADTAAVDVECDAEKIEAGVIGKRGVLTLLAVVGSVDVLMLVVALTYGRSRRRAGERTGEGGRRSSIVQ